MLLQQAPEEDDEAHGPFQRNKAYIQLIEQYDDDLLEQYQF
jgi:hypothetical protein